MYDYKNQLSTIQTLIKNGHTNEALSFTQKLTESIAVEMSAINTNHPVFNAVLNQKYRSMQEKHIAVILKVGDLQEICLEDVYKRQETYASYTNRYGDTQNAGNKTGRTYKNAHEYKNYLTQKYDCLRSRDYSVNINSSLLSEAMRCV